MMHDISPNTQALLLLTAPLITGPRSASVDPISLGEYKLLASHLREIHRQPADLLAPDASEILEECQRLIEEHRRQEVKNRRFRRTSSLQQLLDRGFLLSQVVEQWRSRDIWVVSVAEPEYPPRLKSRLGEDAPPVLYGCGEMGLLDTGGLAVVGSRHVDDSLLEYTMEVGRLAARARRTVVSGGAKGIDQAAMRGALEEGGTVCGVLAGGLEKSAMIREHRDMIQDGRLVLVSPFDPRAGFDAGNAMQRNKLIYALADAALVVNSDYKKGGTWAGAIEQLGKRRLVPVYVRSTGRTSVGLEALRQQGALLWPNPEDVEQFEALFSAPPPSKREAEATLPFETTIAPDDGVMSAAVDLGRDGQPPVAASEELAPATPPIGDVGQSAKSELSPAEVIYQCMRGQILRILVKPRTVREVADQLGVLDAQSRAWLERLANDNHIVRKSGRPVQYERKAATLFSG